MIRSAPQLAGESLRPMRDPAYPRPVRGRTPVQNRAHRPPGEPLHAALPLTHPRASQALASIRSRPLTHLTFPRLALVCLALLQGACVLDKTPALGPCRDGAGYRVAPDRSAGALRILPSAVEGVDIDTAAWMTLAGMEGVGASAYLILTARLRADALVEVDGLALLYRLGGAADPPVILDAQLHAPIYTATPEERQAEHRSPPPGPRRLDGGQTLRTERIEALDAGPTTGRSVPLAGCPASVQLVREADLALHVGSGRAWARQPRDPARDAAAAPESARVVWDTVIGGVVAGIVANPSGDTLTRAVATLVLSPPVDPPTRDAPARPSGEPARTLEYVLDPLAPGAVVGFAGGGLHYGERVVERRVRQVPPGERLPGTPLGLIEGIEKALRP